MVETGHLAAMAACWSTHHRMISRGIHIVIGGDYYKLSDVISINEYSLLVSLIISS